MGTLETLVAECRNYDHAILVLTPDDTRTKRHQLGSIPRDNVVFELGLFMGALGRERVFMVVQAGTDLPTDLAGITPAQFNADDEDQINLVSALGPATTMLEIAMDLI
jgi:predicted nucleotide-binding protein